MFAEGKRIAVVDKKKCNPDSCSRECVRFCPKVRSGDEAIKIEGGKAVINEDICIGCGICVKKCPKKAIKIVNLSSEPENEVHRYGKNGFRLYGLPNIKKGCIVGILGPNGVGKSTAVKILAGVLKPNLGILDREVDWNDILERFKGKEVFNHLKLIAEGKLKVSYKIQEVEAIRSHLEGNVKDYLEKINPDALEKAKEYLPLERFVNKEIKELSGGELQMFAIIVAFSKDADVYLFDEPSAYLDVKQRINAAKLIRALKEKGKSVIVVEHDLTIMDLVADYIHILYGVPQVYGITSGIYSARRGINNYLDGYIKEENVRFRDEKIDFRQKSKEVEEGNKILEYSKMRKTYSSFSLEIDEGDVKENEIIAVLGENALGKTTFAKIIAGEIKPDEGEIKEKAKISYKPQYIIVMDDVKDVPVSLFLTKCGNNWDKKRIVRYLELENLLERKLSELSGGELQRVAIAGTLLRNADIYLFDEPSAYLDVEQRLSFGKLINRFVEETAKTCMIIDHDLLLLTYLARKSLVFSGIPSKKGHCSKKMEFIKGMNLFLSNLGITFRRDEESFRPRANKLGSQKDADQKRTGKYFII